MDFKIAFNSTSDIPIDFIDNFLNVSNPTYFVIYLNAFRRVFNGETTISYPDIAMEIEFATENDVIACFKYFEQKKIIIIDNELITFLPINEEIESQEEESVVIDIEKKPTYSMREIENYRNIDKKLNDVYVLADKYFGRTLTTSDMFIIMDIYDRLGLPAEVIEFLIEHHVQKGINNLNKMEKVAVEWHSRGVKTKEDALRITNYKNEDYVQIRKALGMTTRGDITSAEEKMLAKFYGEYGYSLEIILEACDAAVMNSKGSTPSFSYLEGTLRNWNNEGVKTLEDVKNRQETIMALNEQKTSKKQKVATKTSKNKFNNFTQDKLDFDLIEKQNRERLEKIARGENLDE